MKILVCISKTPDTTAKIAFTDNNSKFAEAGVQWIINPYDEWYALVRAIELKEADPATTIHPNFYQGFWGHLAAGAIVLLAVGGGLHTCLHPDRLSSYLTIVSGGAGYLALYWRNNR